MGKDKGVGGGLGLLDSERQPQVGGEDKTVERGKAKGHFWRADFNMNG